MKKNKVLINIILGCIIVFGIIAFALIIDSCKQYYSNYIFYKNELPLWEDTEAKDEMIYWMIFYRSEFLKHLFSIMFAALSAIASGAILVIINVTDVKNAIFQHSQLTEQRLAAKEQTKAARAEEAKQAKITELEAQLEELKKG